MVIGTTRNAVFMSWVFVSLGALFAWGKEKMANDHGTVFLPCLAYVILLIEGLLIKAIGHPLEWNTYFSSSIAVFFLFRYAISSERKWLFSETTGKRLRDLVEIIFLSHLWVRALVDAFLARIAPEIMNSSFRYGLICLISLAIGHLVLFLSSKRPFYFLKQLF